MSRGRRRGLGGNCPNLQSAHLQPRLPLYLSCLRSRRPDAGSFIRVYRSLDQYNPKQGDLQNWLMRLARNLIIDDYRKRQRAPQDDAAEDLEDHQYHLRAAGGTVQRQMERQELGAQVQAGIDKLSPDLRTCVILRDIEELSYQEIVDLLKIPEGTVKSRINRGRIELAKILRRMRVVEA